MEALLEQLTVKDLRSMAAALDIRGRSSMSKQDLAAAIATRLRAEERARPSGPEPVPKPDRRGRLTARLQSYIDEASLCQLTIGDAPCGLPVVKGTGRCVLHGGIDTSSLSVPVFGHLGFDTWPALLRHLMLASYDIDALGLDPVVAEMAWHLFNYLYFDYFRVEVEGVEHLPLDGPAVLAANHGGAAFPYDGIMLTLAVANEAAVPRRVRVVATELFNMLPFASHLYRKAGGAYAAPEDAAWILRSGGLVGVFPEGVRGFQKPLVEAYRLRRFGRGGFVRQAAAASAPIIPVAILGSEEVHPAVFTSKRLAKLVRTVFPEQRVDELAVWLNPIPLPVHWHIRFLEPIEPPPRGVADPLALLEATEEVRSQIQSALDQMRSAREGLF